MGRKFLGVKKCRPEIFMGEKLSRKFLCAKKNLGWKLFGSKKILVGIFFVKKNWVGNFIVLKNLGQKFYRVEKIGSEIWFGKFYFGLIRFDSVLCCWLLLR